MSKKISTSEFIERAKKTHGNKYDYSKCVYTNSSTKIKIICQEHGEFWQLPFHHLNGSGCKKCSYIGNTTILNLNDFLSQAAKVHGEKYDYSQSDFTKARNNVKIICPNHGNFFQTPYSHVINKRGCPKCAIDSKKISLTSFIERSKEIHGDKFDYSCSKLLSNHKIGIICPEHGKFVTNIYSHLNGDGGCPDCRKDKLSNLYKKDIYDFIKSAKKIHGDRYDYSKSKYTACYDQIEIICKKHGSFFQQANNHLTGYGCPTCGYSGSKFEDFIEKYLKKHKIKYTKRNKSIIKPLEIDFYLPDYNIAIEVNGIYWHSELNGKTNKYHLFKTDACKRLGIRLIHITDAQITFNKRNVVSNLNSILNINKRKIYARKCEVKEISKELKSKFLNKYHDLRNDHSSIRLGLFYKNKLVSVMTFCKPRISLGGKSKSMRIYELSRYSGIYNFYVIGGASKLYKYFERNYNPSKVITYADKSRSVGNLYQNLGFIHTHDSKPNYWYFNRKQPMVLFHRFNFRKSVLHKKLHVFDPNKTEWENMKENNWDRYWDCGTMVFKKEYI